MIDTMLAQENRLRTFVNYLNLEAEVKDGQSRVDAVRCSLHMCCTSSALARNAACKLGFVLCHWCHHCKL